MRLLPLLTCAASVRALDILITNDNGFAAANIREMHREMTALGHNCYIIASSSDQFGQGAGLVFAGSAALTDDSEFGTIKAGAPLLGNDPPDDHVWDYDGSPATQVLVALDYVLPNQTTAAGLQDPATITGRLATALVQALTSASSSSSNPSSNFPSRILPLGYGVPGEIEVINSCRSSAVVFTTDYDAPFADPSAADPYAQLLNATQANASVAGPASTTSSSTATAAATATSLPKSEGERQKQVDTMSSLALVIGVAAVLTLL